MAEPREEFTSTIGTDAVFKGQLKFKKSLHLLGKVDGEINSNGQLFIGDNAVLTGNATAESIRLDGTVEGNLSAQKKVQLSASAKLQGDLETARLEVAEGAVLVGRCTIGVNGHSATAAAGKNTSSETAPVAVAASGKA